MRAAPRTAEAAAFALANYRHALTLARDGRADAVCFTPFNKQAMRLAHSVYDDEISFTADVLGLDGPASEFNVLDGLWNARVTSHMPLAEVASLITGGRDPRALELTDASLRTPGSSVRASRSPASTRMPATAAISAARRSTSIGPAVEASAATGSRPKARSPPTPCSCARRRGEFDAVLTMYHDQGQIAMKLMGFDRGVTLLGGFPFPICTPAHGTAYDIAGKGIANVGAARAAILLAAEMAQKQNLT